MRPSYMTAVLGAAHPPALRGLAAYHPVEIAAMSELSGLSHAQLAALSPEELEGLFDFVGKAVKAVGKAVGGAAKAVGHAVSDAADAVDKAYVAVTPRWLRKGLGAVVAPVKLVWDTADNIAHGQRIDRALIDAGNNQLEIFKVAAPIAQLGLSFIPGIGTAAAGVLGAAIALANGKSITDALIATVAGAMPGGPLVAKAVDIGARAAIGIAEGKRFDTVALDAIRNNLPGGEAVKIAFDTGLALAQGKKIQEAGLDVVEHLIPDNPLAHGAYEMTRRALAGKPLEGATHTAMRRAETRGVPVRPSPPAHKFPPLPRRAPMRVPMMHLSRMSVRTLAAPAPAASSSHVVPIAIGAVTLAAAGGGAWWWWSQQQQKRSEQR